MSENQDEHEIKFIECKFTIDSREGMGGNWERNIGGSTKEKRITFDGYVNQDLYAALISAIGEVVKA